MDTYIEVVMEMYFALLELVMYLLLDGNHATFGLCHDSLNWLNSGKLI